MNRIDFCRTRYIDDALCKALQAGIDQVVILGVGFDARAYRTPGIDHAHVFELDLPALIGDCFVSTKQKGEAPHADTGPLLSRVTQPLTAP